MTPEQERRERRRRWVRKCIQDLRHGEGRTRREAAATLARLRVGRAVPDLIRALSDPESAVRAQAARSLGRLGGARALLPLCRVIDDADASVSWAAVGAIDRLVGSPDPAVHEALREIPAAMGAAAIRPMLKALRRSRQNEWWVASALAGLAERCPAPELREALPRLRELNAERCPDGTLQRAPDWLLERHASLPGTEKWAEANYRLAIVRIDRATEATEDLPLPASAPATVAEHLPIPSRAPAPDPRDLPVPSAPPADPGATDDAPEPAPEEPWWRRIGKALRD